MPRSYGEVMSDRSIRAAPSATLRALTGRITMPSLAQQIEAIPEDVSQRLDRFAFDRQRLVRLGELLRQGKDDSGVVTGRLEPPRPSDISRAPRSRQRRMDSSRSARSRRARSRARRPRGARRGHGDAHGRRREGARRSRPGKDVPRATAGRDRSRRSARRRDASALAHDERGDRRQDPRGARLDISTATGSRRFRRSFRSGSRRAATSTSTLGVCRASTRRATAICRTL